jgi:hypothetical protein
MKNPRKHAELIKQWADDDSLVIEVKSSTGDWLKTTSPWWSEDEKYRIKPEVINYRVALFDNGVSAANDYETSQEYESLDSFIKWITDWIEVEI